MASDTLHHRDITGLGRGRRRPPGRGTRDRRATDRRFGEVRIALQLTSYSGHEISPALSPGGNEVAFSWQGDAGDNWDIYVIQPGSDGLLRLTEHPGDDLFVMTRAE